MPRGADPAALIKILDEAGVLIRSLCVEDELGRLELSASSLEGRSRLIPLTELAIWATELRAYDKAAFLLASCYPLSPEAPELHDIHTVAGLIAAAEGRIEEAQKQLAESAAVCRTSKYAELLCAIRPFNLTLAEKLLESGKEASVIKYFEQCERVWSYEAVRIQQWIESIRARKRPAFYSPGIRNSMSKPTARIHDLVIRGIFLNGDPQSLDDATFTEMRARYMSDISAALTGRLKIAKN